MQQRLHNKVRDQIIEEYYLTARSSFNKKFKNWWAHHSEQKKQQ
jgi:hypothetical protein